VIDNYPSVTVLMSVYNGEKYLSDAIDSILNQTFPDFELLIINDGSIDGSSEILHNYSQQDKRIRLHHQTNQGLIAALNKGLELARGKFIARMDADDVSLPERLAIQLAFLEAHPDVGVLGSGAVAMDSSGISSYTVQFPMQHDVLRWFLCFTNPIVHPTAMMRQPIVAQVGGYNAAAVHAEDYDLWCRLCCVTRLSNLQNVLLLLRKHDSNVSKVHTTQQLQNSVHISHLMISHILNEEISSDIVQRLWDNEFQKSSDVRPVAKLLYRLYHAFVSNNELSIKETQIIQRYAAMRLYGLARPWAQDVNVWGVLAQAFYLDPELLLRPVKRRLMHAFGR